MLRVDADSEFVDYFQRCRIDDPDVVGAAIGHVDARQMIRNTELSLPERVSL